MSNSEGPNNSQASRPAPPGQGTTPTAHTQVDLSSPHPEIPALSRSDLYDLISSMYLDCKDDVQVADALSAQFNVDIGPADALALRREAAKTAIKQDSVDIKRAWIHRYKQLTVNNLVKEYMFLENKHGFLQAKREMAEEMSKLVESTPRERLWIAINNAVGRNNVDLDLVTELIAYGQSVKKLEGLVAQLAKLNKSPVKDQMKRLSYQLTLMLGPDKGTHKLEAAKQLSRLLMQKTGIVTEEDVDCLEEYSKSVDDNLPTDKSFSLWLLQGADLEEEDLTALEQILGRRDRMLAEDDICDFPCSMRERPMLVKAELEMIHEYATHHLSLHGITGEPGKASTDGDKADPTVEALQAVKFVAADHLDILDFARFYTAEELATAKEKRVPDTQLQANLNRFNNLENYAAVKSVMQFLGGRSTAQQPEFPATRYLQKRFARTE